MKRTPLKVFGAYTIQPDRHIDHRGSFQEFYSAKPDSYPVYSFKPEQVNISCSQKNVLRGLHIVPFVKLVQCVQGVLFDVVVDMRKESPTYLQWDGVWLSEEQSLQVYVPSGCGHGFLAADDLVTLLYAQSSFYDPSKETSVNWQDSTIGVKWPDLGMGEYIVSPKDKEAPFLNAEGK